MNFPPIQLPDEPLAALDYIASYLNELRTDRARQVLSSDIEGFIQTTDYCDGLRDITRECQRLIQLHTPKPTEPTELITLTYFYDWGHGHLSLSQRRRIK